MKTCYKPQVNYTAFDLVRSVVILLLGFLLITAQPAHAYKWSYQAEITSEFTYSYLREGKLPPGLKAETEFTGNTTATFSLNHIVNNWELTVTAFGRAEDFSGEIQKLTACCLLGSAVVETGLKDWSWGKGYSSSPTTPWLKEERYLGFEATFFSANSHTVVGGILDQEKTGIEWGWLRMGTLLDTGDYEIVVTCSPGKADQSTRCNLGTEFSRDFLNGLAVHGGLNILRAESGSDVYYILGGSYIGEKLHLLLEAAGKGGTIPPAAREEVIRDYLLVSVGNNSSVLADWQWSVRNWINLTDGGEVRSLQVGYFGIKDFEPLLEIKNFAGCKSSTAASNPAAWVFTLQMKASI